MKNKKNISIATIIVFVAFLAYIILCYKPLSTELQLTPQWTTEIKQENVNPKSSLKVLPFRLGQNTGYFTHEGKIALLHNFEYKASICSDFFCSYMQDSREVQIMNPEGETIGTIKGGGFPYLTEGKIFLMLPGGAGFELRDLNNNTLARYENTSPITAFNSSPMGTVAGFADGSLYVFNEKFDLIDRLEPGGSDYPTILGANISSNGNYFACVTGQNKQRFILYKVENYHNKPIFHHYLNNSIVNQTLVAFTKDESKVYYNDATGLGIVDTSTCKYSHIDIPGRILDIRESPVAKSVFVLSKEKDTVNSKYTVSVIEQQKYKTGSFSFNANSAFILTDENALFIGKDDKISKLIISKE